MFTGIVERTIEIQSVTDHDGGRRITLPYRWGDETHGESIAINGCCLTVAQIDDDALHFDVIRETLDKTNLGRVDVGSLVHVERSLRAGDRIDGHFVQGHVDGLATLTDRVASEAEWRLSIEVAEPFRKYVLPKGSIAIDGTSLTVAAVTDSGFEVALIPTTLEKTALGRREVGYQFNFEADMMSKTIVETVQRLGR